MYVYKDYERGYINSLHCMESLIILRISLKGANIRLIIRYSEIIFAGGQWKTQLPTNTNHLTIHTPCIWETAYEEITWKTCALASYKGIGLGMKDLRLMLTISS